MDFKILDICKKQKITQKELAEKIGMSAVGLSKAINGNPTIDTLEKIANALGVHISELFEQPETDTMSCPHCGGGIKISKS